MLDEKDSQAVSNLMDEKLQAPEERLLAQTKRETRAMLEEQDKRIQARFLHALADDVQQLKKAQ